MLRMADSPDCPDKGHGQFWIRACVHVQCKQVELCRFRYGSEFVQTCVDEVSNYMYQSNNFFVVVQLSDKLLATKVFMTTTLSFFVYKHSSIYIEILDFTH